MGLIVRFWEDTEPGKLFLQDYSARFSAEAKTNAYFCNMMIQRLFLFGVALLAAILSWAQGLRHQPLRYMPADSVLLLDRDKTNFVLSAFVVDTALQPYPYRIYAREEAGKAVGKALPSGDVYEVLARIDHFAALLPWTAESRLVDTLEYDLYNMVLPVLNYPSFERHPAAQALRSVPSLVYMADGRGFYVNLFVNAFAHIRTDSIDLTVDQVTGMPFMPQVRLRLGGLSGLTPLAVRVRVPAWQPVTPMVYVNGHETDCIVENGYLVLDRSWNNGDELFLEFDLTPRRLPNPRLLRRGPLLFVADAPIEGNVYESDDEDESGHLMLQGEGWKARPAMDL